MCVCSLCTVCSPCKCADFSLPVLHLIDFWSVTVTLYQDCETQVQYGHANRIVSRCKGLPLPVTVPLCVMADNHKDCIEEFWLLQAASRKV